MRGYDDPCGIARALGLVGDRWALLVVRELIYGPKRFTDLRAGLHGISENVLSQRLRDLEQADVLQRRKLGPPVGTWSYELTERGRGLHPVLIALGQWGSRLPVDQATHPELSTDALVFALATTFDADVAGPLETVVHLRIGDDSFRAEAGRGQFRAERGAADSADVTITTNTATLQSLVFAGESLATAEASGTVTVTGDRRAVEHLLQCFPPSVRATSPI